MSLLRDRRTARKLTLKHVADQVGTDAGNLSRIERGDQFAGRDLAKRLADFFDLSVEQVLYPETQTASETSEASAA